MAIVAATLLLVAGTACSKKSSESVSTDTTPAAAADANSTDGASDEPVDDEASDDEATDDENDGGSASGGDCPTQSEVDALEQSLDGMESVDSLSSGEAAGALEDALDTMAGYLPADYDGDVETLRDGLLALLGLYQDIDMNNPTPEQIAQIEAAMADIDEAELEAASLRIEQYFTDNCPDVVFPE